jgi:hypothetical protein
VGKERLEGDCIRKNDCEGVMQEGAGHFGKVIGPGQPATHDVFLLLSLALLSKIATFALF